MQGRRAETTLLPASLIDAWGILAKMLPAIHAALDNGDTPAPPFTQWTEALGKGYSLRAGYRRFSEHRDDNPRIEPSRSGGK
jgi:hypothetical protein